MWFKALERNRIYALQVLHKCLLPANHPIPMCLWATHKHTSRLVIIWTCVPIPLSRSNLDTGVNNIFYWELKLKNLLFFPSPVSIATQHSSSGQFYAILSSQPIKVKQSLRSVSGTIREESPFSEGKREQWFWFCRLAFREINFLTSTLLLGCCCWGFFPCHFLNTQVLDFISIFFFCSSPNSLPYKKGIEEFIPIVRAQGIY